MVSLPSKPKANIFGILFNLEILVITSGGGSLIRCRPLNVKVVSTIPV